MLETASDIFYRVSYKQIILNYRLVFTRIVILNDFYRVYNLSSDPLNVTLLLKKLNSKFQKNWSLVFFKFKTNRGWYYH